MIFTQKGTKFDSVFLRSSNLFHFDLNKSETHIIYEDLPIQPFCASTRLSSQITARHVN